MPLPGSPPPPPSAPPTLDQRTERLIRPWWDHLKAAQPARVPGQSYPSVKGVVRAALGNGKPERLIVAGLNILVTEGRSISGGTLQTAMTAAARHPNAPAEFRPYAADGPAPAAGRPSRTDARIAGLQARKAALQAQRAAEAAAGGIR